MRHRKSKPGYKGLAVSLVFSGIIIAIGLSYIDSLTPAAVIQRLLFPLVRLTAFISLGLLVGQYLELSGLTRKLSVLARPMFRFGKLGDRCGSSFTMAFVSGVAANSMLREFYQDGKISKQQVYLTNFVSHLPAYFLHLPTTFFIVMPLTGVAGAIYFGITFGATILRVFLFLLYGHLVLKTPPEYEQTSDPEEASEKNQKNIWSEIRNKLPARIMKVFVWVLPVYILVYVANLAGFFELMDKAFSGFVLTRVVPTESLSVVVLSFVAEFTSGFAAAGALLHSGVITVKQTVIALLAGNIIAFPIRALRHQLPWYIGIFSPKMGASMLLAGQFFRIGSIILVGFLYYIIF